MSENSEIPQPAPIKETVAKPEKLIGPESSGAQALMLLGIKPPEKGGTLPVIKKEELQRIAEGGLEAEHKKNILNGSLNERDEYWKKKGVKEEERMGVWTRQLDGFINKYKNNPKQAGQQEFLKRILGADSLEKVNATAIYETFMQGEGKGDVEFYARRIVATNNQEQIEQNREFIEKLGKIFGDNSAKISGLLAYGIANGRRNPGEFATSAEAQFKKGNFGDRGVWETLEKNSHGWGDKEIKRLADEQLEKQKKEQEEKLQKLRAEAVAEPADGDKKETAGDRVAEAGEKAKEGEEQDKKQGSDAQSNEAAKGEGAAAKPGDDEGKPAEKGKTAKELEMELDHYLADTSPKGNSFTKNLHPFLNTIKSNLPYVKDAEYVGLAGSILDKVREIDKTEILETNELLKQFIFLHAQLQIRTFYKEDERTRNAFMESANSLKFFLEEKKVEFSNPTGQEYDHKKMLAVPVVVENEDQIGKILNGLQYSINGEVLTSAVRVGVTKEQLSQMEASAQSEKP